MSHSSCTSSGPVVISIRSNQQFLSALRYLVLPLFLHSHQIIYSCFLSRLFPILTIFNYLKLYDSHYNGNSCLDHYWCSGRNTSHRYLLPVCLHFQNNYDIFNHSFRLICACLLRKHFAYSVPRIINKCWNINWKLTWRVLGKHGLSYRFKDRPLRSLHLVGCVRDMMKEIRILILVEFRDAELSPNPEIFYSLSWCFLEPQGSFWSESS